MDCILYTQAIRSARKENKTCFIVRYAVLVMENNIRIELFDFLKSYDNNDYFEIQSVKMEIIANTFSE